MNTKSVVSFTSLKTEAITLVLDYLTAQYLVFQDQQTKENG